MATFWAAPCSPSAKRYLLGALVTCFLIQSYLVYSDPTAREALTPEAVAGRRIWHEQNCNACHQLYGFGGFLGPDLTNAAPRLTQERLEQVLTQGSGAMPALGLAGDEILAVGAFLRAMDKTGRGQARLIPETPQDPVVDRITARVAGDAARGFELFRSRACLSCHTPFGVSLVGAPDPSRVELTRPELMRVLTDGRPPRMPPPNLTADEREAVAAFLDWLGAHREELGAGEGGALPWWEYR